MNCMEEVEVTPEYLKRVGLNPDDFQDITFYKGAGCHICNNTGFKGRIGIYEIMTMSPKLQELILEKVSADRIQELAVKEGMKTLRDAGIEKLKRGITTIEEVLRETTIK